jgi:lysophospholipase L1-like esterase
VPIDNTKGPLGTLDCTLRENIHTSLPGKTVRIVVSNEMGTTPLNIGGAIIALSAPSPARQRAVTFAGRPSTIVPAGAKLFSDALDFDLPAGANLAISLFVPKQSVPTLTMHAYANQPNFMAPGDQTSSPTLTQPVESDSWLFLTAVEVQAPAQAGSIVTLGDSITDGAVSARGGNRRWPDDLARRLQADPKTASLGVLNEGIGGNRILHSDIGTNAGPGALARFDRDVLSQAGVKYLIILEGVNDIGVGTGPINPHDTVSPQQLIDGLTQLIDRAHTHGIKVYLGTIMPDKGLGLYYTEAGEAERQAVNLWIRSNKLSDAVIDFDKAVRDPADPQRLLPAFDGGDHIHPGDAGHQAMADAIDLRLFNR